MTSWCFQIQLTVMWAVFPTPSTTRPWAWTWCPAVSTTLCSTCPSTTATSSSSSSNTRADIQPRATEIEESFEKSSSETKTDIFFTTFSEWQVTEGGYSIVLKGQFGIIKGSDASFGWFCRDGWLSLRNVVQLHNVTNHHRSGCRGAIQEKVGFGWWLIVGLQHWVSFH